MSETPGALTPYDDDVGPPRVILNPMIAITFDDGVMPVILEFTGYQNGNALEVARRLSEAPNVTETCLTGGFPAAVKRFCERGAITDRVPNEYTIHAGPIGQKQLLR